MPSTLEWLRTRQDQELVALLRARPDLIVPTPGDLTVLAGRLNTGPSVWRAMESLTQFHIEVLSGLAVIGAHRRSVQRAELTELIGSAVPADAIDDALAHLGGLGLVRGDGTLQMVGTVLNALGAYPAGLAPAGGLSPAEAAAAVAGLTDAERSIVNQLAHDIPRGTVQSGSRVSRTVRGLVAAGVLREVEPDVVELPSEVALAVRGERPLGPLHPRPPEAPATATDAATVDGAGAGQSVACVLRWRHCVELLGRAPAPVLRSGGMGIRDLRRLAKLLGCTESDAALDIELLVASGAVATADPRSALSMSWTPTPLADELLAGDEEDSWAGVAATWLDLRRAPSRAGSRDVSDKVQNALSPELSWLRGPADRRQVLRALADLPAGSGLPPADLSARLAWRSPLRPAEQRAALAESTVAEATTLGVVAFDAMTSAGRALLAGDLPAAGRALTAALPPRVDRITIQADLTVVAPGRLERTLQLRLSGAADVESAGSATVFRVTPQSIRRALDAGAAAADLHELFERHSTTGVPQALTYLIDDVGRRHGRLRVGAAGTYLRSDDPAVLDQAMGAATAMAIGVRRLAPTVAVTTTSVEDVIDQLRAAGLVPAAEDAGGQVVDLRAPRHRTRQVVPDAHQHWREPPQPTEDQLAAVVRRMRAADRAGVGHRDEEQSHRALSVLREAVQGRTPVWIGYVDAEGALSHRLIEPVSIAGGAVVAYDRLRSSMRTFTLHRITAIRPAEDADMLDDLDGLDRVGGLDHAGRAWPASDAPWEAP